MEEIKKEYDEILASGRFGIYFPELSRVWEKDEEEFTAFVEKRNGWLESLRIEL